MTAAAPIRLIAFDLDQTLFGVDQVIRPRVQAAIAQARLAGVAITIATGRNAGVAGRFACQLGVTVPIICVQGGCVYDHQQGKPLHDVRLKPELVPQIVAAAERYGWNIHFESLERNYLPAQSDHPPIFYELLRNSPWVRVNDLLRDIPELPHKVIVSMAHPNDLARTVSEMNEALGTSLTIVPSHPYLVEGLPENVDKGRALAWLADYLGIPQPEVMAIGDSGADIPMIEWAGVGVAMGNGSGTVKAAADWVAPTLEEDGAAVAIERFCFAGRSGL